MSFSCFISIVNLVYMKVIITYKLIIYVCNLTVQPYYCSFQLVLHGMLILVNKVTSVLLTVKEEIPSICNTTLPYAWLLWQHNCSLVLLYSTNDISFHDNNLNCWILNNSTTNFIWPLASAAFTVCVSTFLDFSFHDKLYSVLDSTLVVVSVTLTPP